MEQHGDGGDFGDVSGQTGVRSKMEPEGRGSRLPQDRGAAVDAGGPARDAEVA
jgi:hypothetical protein